MGMTKVNPGVWDAPRVQKEMRDSNMVAESRGCNWCGENLEPGEDGWCVDCESETRLPTSGLEWLLGHEPNFREPGSSEHISTDEWAAMSTERQWRYLP